MKLKYITTILLSLNLLVGCTSNSENFLSSSNNSNLTNNNTNNTNSNLTNSNSDFNTNTNSINNSITNIYKNKLNNKLFNNKNSSNFEENTSKENTSKENTSANNASDTNDSKPKAESKLDKIIPAINEIVGEYKDNIALYYYNFDSNETYCFNENKYYLSASLRKVPLVMQVLDKVNSDELSLGTLVEYQDIDYAGGTGILQNEEYIGSRTIKELVELSMTESDNIAFNMLNRICNYTLIEYTNTMLGSDCMIEEDGYIKLTAKHNFEIMFNLYTNPNNNPYYDIIIESLKHTAFNVSINKYLPEDTVAHKIGSFYRSYHDSGIIFGDETYILVVLTRDVGTLTDSDEFTNEQEERFLVDWGKEAFELIANISKSIYDIIHTSQ